MIYKIYIFYMMNFSNFLQLHLMKQLDQSEAVETKE